MYRGILLGTLLLLSGCGENSNTPLAGDIASLAVEANATTFYATQKVQMSAVASYTNGVPDSNATEFVEWSESNSSIAFFSTTDAASSPGLLSGGEFGGDVEITGSYKQFFDTAVVHVHALTSVTLSIENNDTNLSQEQTLQLQALGTFDDNTTLDVTESMTWILGNAGESNATLEQNGTLYTGDANGTLDINVTRYDVNASLTVSVTP
ncbi:Ig-like domain-containing protein [Sulfurimonas sp. HSL-3221]|uniref:Ig-like domain-containing protein n=1 Tax=Sulfurimonadaceae TaxID=2771471 RepID=UPI001E5619E0|nr:Ig-like domain-containing protein [Sulfurimonas sp. HSL-3221]UFS62329.1 Ig-like domain-containing protein [Sulfurimonas sp. HSL-3221]